VCCALGLGLLGQGEVLTSLQGLATENSNGNTRAFASGILGLLSDPQDLPVFYRFRSNNLFYFEVPELREIMLLL
jgi:hypothetical protein